MIKYIFIVCLSLIFFQVGASDAGTLLGEDKISDTFKWGSWDLVQTADNMLWYIIGLFYFIAVALWIYGWFIILTSWWDEDKVKKWKNIIIYMVVGLVVIFVASQIVTWVIDVMNQTSAWETN